MIGATSASDSAIVGPDRVRLVIQGILRAAQVDGWTDDTLSAATGVAGRTIKSYRIEGKEPCLSNALSIACVIGPKAINPLLAIIGYAAKPLDEPDEIQPCQIVADAMAGMSVIANAAADNRIDHTEEAGCRAAADAIIAAVAPLSSMADAA